MAVGAREFIDKLLVEKYAQEKVDNHDEDALVSKVSANDMLNMMAASSMASRNMLELNSRLTMVCYGVVARSAKYIKTDDTVCV